MIIREDWEIDDLIEKCEEEINKSDSRFPKTYEQGIKMAIMWLSNYRINDILNIDT